MRRLTDGLDTEKFQVLAINLSEKRSTIERRMKRFKIDFNVLLDTDGAVFKRWGGTILPTSYLVDRHGKVRYRAIGPLNWDSEEVIDSIRHLLDEE